MDLAIQAKKAEDFGRWYQEIVIKAELIDYSDVGGCYILRPNAYDIWEFIKTFLDLEIKDKGVRNCYFPLFITKSALEKESSHIDDFTPEVAWVTRSGKSDLDEPLAIRPTSETGMYPMYSKWIRNHRDLPLKLNQWNNVVRWEFKKTTPFIRSREFLWQEGHSCFATEQEAIADTNSMIDVYEDVYETMLAIPTIKGTKTTKEKFAGANMTRTLEAFIPTNGKAIQAATSHYLGQNFSKEELFNIWFEDENSTHKYVYQNSWGFTTRSMGVMIMVHSDDKGLVLPPPVAPIHVVIVPIYKNGLEDAIVDDYAQTIMGVLKNWKGYPIRVHYDDRKNYRPGFKFNYYEMLGVPLRIDIGHRDVSNQTFDLMRRDTLEKDRGVNWSASKSNGNLIQVILESIQKNLYDTAKNTLHGSIKICNTKLAVRNNVALNFMVLIPFCGDVECENDFKTEMNNDDCHIKSLCIPDYVEEDELQCIHCDKEYKGKPVLFGKSY